MATHHKSIPTSSVRQRLADATREQHEALHRHSISLALINDPTPCAISASLRASLLLCRSLGRAVEARSVFQNLSTDSAAQCLLEDLNETDRSAEGSAPAWIENDDQLLGALYVAHGAQFGRQQIRSHLRSAGVTPIPRYFLERPNRDQWRSLLAELERHGADEDGYVEIEAGARSAFSAYADSLDAAAARHSI